MIHAFGAHCLADSCTAAKRHCSSCAGALLGCRRGPSGGGTDWPGAHDALTHGGGQRDHEVAADHLDLDGPQTHAWVALVLAGGNVKLVTVPGAGDVGVILRERKP